MRRLISYSFRVICKLEIQKNKFVKGFLIFQDLELLIKKGVLNNLKFIDLTILDDIQLDEI